MWSSGEDIAPHKDRLKHRASDQPLPKTRLFVPPSQRGDLRWTPPNPYAAHRQRARHPMYGQNDALKVFEYFAQRATPLASNEVQFSSLTYLPLEELAQLEFPPLLTPIYHPRQPRPHSRGTDIISTWYDSLPHIDVAPPGASIVRCTAPISISSIASYTPMPPVASPETMLNQSGIEEPLLVLHPKTTRVIVDPHVLSARACRGVLVLMRGLPGSGKSTVTNVIARAGAVMCSADAEITTADGTYLWSSPLVSAAHKLCYSKAVAAMAAQQPVVVDNTNVSFDAMRPYIEAAVAMDYAVVTVESNTPWARDPTVLVDRTLHKVPVDTIQKMLYRYAKIRDLARLLPFRPREQPTDTSAPPLVAGEPESESHSAPTASTARTSMRAFKAPIFRNDVHEYRPRNWGSNRDGFGVSADLPNKIDDPVVVPTDLPDILQARHEH